MRSLTLVKPLVRYARRPARVRCDVLRIEAQHVVLLAPDGSEVWAQRCDGTLTGAKGGKAAGSRALPSQWEGWRVLRWHSLPGFWVETPNR